MTRKDILKAIGVVLLGTLGMGVWEFGSMFYRDWYFLHRARMAAERPVVTPEGKQ